MATQNPILTSEHVFVAGMTGTGKSFLARNYLSQFPRVWMLDTKGESIQKLSRKENPWPEVDPKELTVITRVDMIPEVTTRFMIYAPDFEELDSYFYDEFFRQAYFHQNLTVWVDEAMSVSENSQTIPTYYKAILTRGRSRETSIWTLTQRPMGLSPLILSQSTHFFVFNLQLEQDRKKITDVTGVPQFMKKPLGHNFWYFRDGWEEAVKAKLVLHNRKGGEHVGR